MGPCYLLKGCLGFLECSGKLCSTPAVVVELAVCEFRNAVGSSCGSSLWGSALWRLSAFGCLTVCQTIVGGKRGASQLPFRRWPNINLVDPASSHMLVSKIKPCMSQYKLLHGETANGSLKQLSFIWWSFITWITMVILELIHAPRPDFVEGLCLLGTEPT